MGTESTDQPWFIGGSLPVENVQAFASNKVDKVPNRYIRTELELENFSLSLDSHLQIPIIDSTKLFTPHCLKDELKKLDAACQEWGFFQLINHGVPLQLMEKMKDDVRHWRKRRHMHSCLTTLKATDKRLWCLRIKNLTGGTCSST